MPRGCCSSSSLLNALDPGSALAGGSVSQQLRAQTERELTARNAQRNSVRPSVCGTHPSWVSPSSPDFTEAPAGTSAQPLTWKSPAGQSRGSTGLEILVGVMSLAAP